MLLVSSTSDALAAGGRIVARTDCQASPQPEPPVILGRRFWNMLSAPARQTPGPVGDEPMVREAALCYFVSDLRAEKGSPQEVNADRLLKLKPAPDPRVPFVAYTHAGRPPFRCLDEFQVDQASYERWKAQYPNFLGFWTGVEWDNEYVGPLCNLESAVRTWRKHGYSETALGHMQRVIGRAVTDRDAAARGLHECYQGLRRYYFNDPQRMIFLRGAWCFDHYPLEWGAGIAVSETTNTGPYRHQVSLFSVRGAARQYGRPWEWYIATYYNGHDANGRPSVNNEPNYVSTTRSAVPGSQEQSGPGFGMSVSLNRRDMYLAYLAGASFVDHEDWGRVYCQRDERNPKIRTLSPHGQAMREWYAFTQRHTDRGVSYAPVALLMPFNQGYPQWGGHPWSHFPIQRPDSMIDAVMYTLVPFTQDTRQGREGCLANSPFGDLYDTLAANPPSGPVRAAVLARYPVAILLGGIDIDASLATRLMDYVRAGGTLVVNARQVNERLPADFLGVLRSGKTAAVVGPVNVGPGESLTLDEPYEYEPLELKGAQALWTDAQGGVLASLNRYGQGRVLLTSVDYLLPRWEKGKPQGSKLWAALLKGKRMPLVESLMRPIVDEVLPVKVVGDIEYGLNRVSDGWWVYLINNRGVTKFTQTPETFDAAQTSKVTVELRRLKVTGLQELRTDRPVALDQANSAFTIDVGPGDIRVVKIATR
jgi:hypothetical protein